MNVVLESLYLRRPRIEYISPAVCPIHFSASGIASFDQCFNDLAFCSARKLNTNFLNFDEPADGLAYNVYYSTQESGQPFQIVNGGLAPKTAVLFTAGTYWFTVNTSAGVESPAFPSIVAGGSQYVTLPIPQTSDAVSWNLYKDGSKLISEFVGAIVESSAEGWYQATKITVDGETPLSGCSALLLSGTVPVPPPPPPPPPPGPDWSTAVYGQALCIDCLGSIPFGAFPASSGGFSPPGANFALTSKMVGGNPAFDYTVNVSGYVQLVYTGPDAHCRLSLSAGLSGGGSISTNNVVEIKLYTDPGFILQLGGPALVSGNYDFDIPGGVNRIIQVIVQGEARANQTLFVAGSFSNIAP